MFKKTLMILLIVCFIFGIGLLVLFFQKSVPDTSVSLPDSKSTPAPVVSFTPVPTMPPQVPELDADLVAIEKDLEKLKKEDLRLSPPVFIFDLGLK